MKLPHGQPVDVRLLAKRKEAAQASGGTSSEAVVSAALASIRRWGKADEILEYGAGTGILLKELIDGGWSGRLTGADLLPRPTGLADSVRWIQADLNLPLDCPDHGFDLIVSTEVIEHLENPRAVAREFARLIRPGGRLLLTTPNQESIRSLASLLFTGHFVAFQDSCYPAHITALLRKDLVRIFQEAGFTDLCFRYVPHGGIPKLPHVTWQRVSSGLLRGRFFSDNLVLEAAFPK